MKSLPHKYFFFLYRTKFQSLTPEVYLQKETVTIEREGYTTIISWLLLGLVN